MRQTGEILVCVSVDALRVACELHAAEPAAMKKLSSAGSASAGVAARTSRA